MTFAQFKAAVIENLGPDAQRSGTSVSGLDAFRARAIVNTMVDLQRYIPALRQHQTNTFTHAQVTAVGRAAQVTLPVGRVEELWIKDATDDQKRHKLDFKPWRDRYVLTSEEIDDGDYFYAIGPDNLTCLFHPGLTTATKLEVVWHGLKISYADNDVLHANWDQATDCVGEYVKSRIVRHYDKDSVARAQRHEADYARLRGALYLELKQ